MSGTSLDGIDVAIVDVEKAAAGIAVRTVAFDSVAYEPELHAAIGRALPPNAGNVRDVCVLNVLVGEAFATALLRALDAARIPLASLDLVGSHGHTLYHLPADDRKKPFARSTLQIGDPSIVAQRTGITCVADFRSADVAAGGQGAPLVSLVDYLLLRDATEQRAALNIGGIANLTILPAGCHADDVRAFDTGPGNLPIDGCAKLASAGALERDDGGRLASAGKAHSRLLAELLAHPFFSLRPPKSAGREQFGEGFARAAWRRGLELGATGPDIVATVTELTAQTIAAAVPRDCARLIASGGGTHNPALMAALARKLARQSSEGLNRTPRVGLSDEFGLAADAKEAIAFAVLAFETMHGRVGNLPACTGAARPAVLGKIAPGANFRRLMDGALR